MTSFQIDNLPEDLYSRIQKLAAENNITFDRAVIELLKQAFQAGEVNIDKEPQTKSMTEILQSIRSRNRVNPSDFGLPDSTIMIREDRNR
jgi:antitoxin FitA